MLHACCMASAEATNCLGSTNTGCAGAAGKLTSGNDGRLHVPVVAHQMAQHTVQARERLFLLDKILGRDLTPADDVQSLADDRRRVVETGDALQLAVVQQPGVEGNARVGRADRKSTRLNSS